MLISEMTEKECRQFLSRSTLGRLACAQENVPYIVPIYFVYEPDHLYGFSTFGKKIEWMRLKSSCVCRNRRGSQPLSLDEPDCQRSI